MSDLSLTKLAETASTLTLGWAPPADVQWYVFFSAGARVSNGAPTLKDGSARSSAKFSKAHEPYEVVAVCRGTSGIYSLSIGKYVSSAPLPANVAESAPAPVVT